MAQKWKIAKDREAEEFLDRISADLQCMFLMSEHEARARIEASWNFDVETIGGPDEVAYHETPEYWANHFYYGPGSCWWIKGRDREERNLPPLCAVPLP